MSADFWAGYVSGAVGIAVGNPLDILKTRLQAGTQAQSVSPSAPPSEAVATTSARPWTSALRGAAAPILGYGALNALLFMTYNRSLALLNTGNSTDWLERPSAWSLWTAGALGGLATFFVSAPTELVKCRAQVSQPPQSTLAVTRNLWRKAGVRGLYLGGGITSIRDAVGYGFYFLSYDLSKRAISNADDSHNQQALKVLLCGGLAGVVTWASIFPLDVVKTRVQTWDLRPINSNRSLPSSTQPLLSAQYEATQTRPSTFQIAAAAYTAEGLGVFFKGLGVCSARAFIVNAVQWAVYEYLLKQLSDAHAT